jgi:hypothetical protein
LQRPKWQELFPFETEPQLEEEEEEEEEEKEEEERRQQRAPKKNDDAAFVAESDELSFGAALHLSSLSLSLNSSLLNPC